MTTQLEHARKGFLTKEMQAVARRDMRWEDLEKFLLFPDLAKNTRQERMPLQKDAPCAGISAP